MQTKNVTKCDSEDSNISEFTTVYNDSYPKGIVNYNIGVTLDKAGFNDEFITTPLFTNISQYTQKVNPNFYFDEKILPSILSFLEKPNDDGLYLYGPSGCGKTSIINQLAARFNWPIIQLTLNGRFELQDLIGHHTIINDQLCFVHGPLARAMKYGYILILNEIDLADPAELAGLNDVLEGRALTIAQNNGEVIYPHDGFRLIVTANTKGNGNSSQFSGTQILNSAFLDRFRFIQCDYPCIEAEQEILAKSAPSLSTNLIEKLIRVANEIRYSHVNMSYKHVYITIPMSTRTLVRWANLIISYKGKVENYIEEALCHAFTARLSQDEATYVNRILKDIQVNE